MPDPLVTLGQLKELVQNVVQHTRPAPTGSGELVHAINFGMEKATRAILAVRHEPFQSYVDPFALESGVDEYDVSLFDPPLWRPHRLLVTGVGGGRTILFRYRALASADFQAAEMSRAGSFSGLLYDVLEGKLPGAQSVVLAGATDTVFQVDDPAEMMDGTLLRLDGIGEAQTLTVSGNVITLTQALSIPPPVDTPVTVLRQRVMKIVPALSEGVAGRLYYQYRPARLVRDGDALDALIAAHRDMVVWYAAHMLLQGVNDAHAQRWFDQAQEMRSELIQDLEPLSGQASEALGTDLDWCD